MSEGLRGSAPGRSTTAAVMLFIVLIAGLVLPSAASPADLLCLPSFGEGAVKVRIYADYFCPPCRAMEPDIEPIIAELVRERTVTLMFVDTPFYRHSSLYARYFLYAINEKKDLDHALYVRRSLIEAAKNGLDSTEKLETFLRAKSISLKPFDPRSTFEVLSRHLKEDGVDATPSCVIDADGKAKKYSGGGNVIDALAKLRQEPPKK